MRPIKYIILHCSASEGMADAKSIKAFHIAKPPQGRGWKDIGYHYVLTKQGNIEFGRPEEEIGAHCEGYNKHSIGICFGGDNKFTKVQLEAGRYLIRDLMKKYSLTADAVVMHSQFDKKGKSCPNPDHMIRSYFTDEGGN